MTRRRPTRKRIRLHGWDYRNAGAYFVTICSHQRRCQFGTVKNGRMRLNAWGQIVVKTWLGTPDHFPRMTLDDFICMPNHFHAILWIDYEEQNGIPAGLAAAGLPNLDSADPVVGQWHAIALQPDQPESHERGPKSGSLGAIIGSFKSAVTQEINDTRDDNHPPIWQGRFHDRIIRNERELYAIRQYIRDNPKNWTKDQEWNAGLDQLLDDE